MKFLRDRALYTILADYSFLCQPINLETRNNSHPLEDADKHKDYIHSQTTHGLLTDYSQITFSLPDEPHPLPDYSHTNSIFSILQISDYSRITQTQTTPILPQTHRLLPYSFTQTDYSHSHTDTRTPLIFTFYKQIIPILT